MALQTDIGAAHARALEQAGTIFAGVRADQLSAPTPCRKWNTRELANHLVGVNWMMSAVGKGEKVDMEGPRPDLVGDDPGGAYETSRRAAAEVFTAPGALERSWALPIGEVPGAMARNIHLMETVIHTWDLAKATGQTNRLDPELGDVVLGLAPSIVTSGIRNESGNPFAQVITVAETAPVYERLAGFLGRTP